MASVSISGDVSGAISIAAPSAAGSGVLTLPTGTDTLVGKATTDTLTNKSIAATQLTGTIAAAALPAGSVLQVVNATYAVANTTTSTSYVDTNLTATITPTRNTSKILVMVCQTGCEKESTNINFLLKLQRNSADIALMEQFGGYNGLTTLQNFGSCTIDFLDSPATTSATTYKTQFACSAAGRVYTQQNNGTSTITLMEIAG